MEGGWVAEVRAFYKSSPLRQKKLSCQATALWHYMIYRLNELYWRQPFCLSNIELAGGAGMSISALKKAREELIWHGLLLYEPQKGNLPPKYTMLSAITEGDLIHCNAGGKK